MNPLDAPCFNQLGPVLRSDSAYGAPLLAEEVTLTAYCSVAVCTVSYAAPKLPHTRTKLTLQALVWSWVLCASEEVEIVKRKGLTMPMITYYVTR